ncbi:MAG: CHAT domain-containing protein [Bacteroidota bacterium]
MKSLFAILLLFTAPLFLKAQIIDSPNLLKDGVREGRWTVLKDSIFATVSDTAQARYFRVITYKNGKPEGIVTDYYISGKKQGESRLLSEDPDVIDDEATNYYEDGSVKAIGHYINGKANGEYISYFENGKLHEKSLYKNDVLDGLSVVHFDNGQKNFEGNYINGKYDGNWTVWKSDGSVEAKYNFKNGIDQSFTGLYGEALRLLKAGETGQAREFAQSAKEFLKIDSTGENRLMLQQFSALVFKKSGDVTRADSLHRQILNVFKNDVLKDNGLIATNLGDKYYNIDEYAYALDVYKIAYKLRSELFKTSSPEYLEAVSNLGYTYRETANYDSSLVFFLKTANARKAAKLDTTAEHATTLRLLAGVYLSLKKTDTAIALLKECIALRRTVLGEAHEDYIAAIEKLGTTYYDLKHYDSTQKIYEDLAFIAAVRFKENSREYIGKLTDLANVYNNTNDFLKAGQMFDYAILQAEKNLPDTAEVLKNLRESAAKFYTNRNNYERSLELYCSIFKTIPHDAGQGYVTLLSAIGGAYENLENYEAAAQYYREETEIQKTLYGEASKKYVYALTDLTALYTKQKRETEAIAMLESALKAQEAAGVPDSSAYSTVLVKLGPLYQDKEEYAKSYRAFTTVMNYQRQHDTAIYLDAVVFYTASIVGRKSFAEGLDIIKESVDIARKKYGVESLEYAMQIYCLASAYLDLKEFDKAEPLFKESINIRLKISSEYSDENARAWGKLAELYGAAMRYDKLKASLAEALAMYKKHYGPSSPAYAVKLRAAAVTIMQTGDYALMEEILREALKIRAEHSSKNSVAYAAALQDVAEAHVLMGRIKEGDAETVEARAIYRANLASDPSGYIDLLLKISDRYYVTRQFSEAEKYCLEAKSVADSVLGSEHPLFLKTLSATAGIYANMGRSAAWGEMIRQLMYTSAKYFSHDTLQYAAHLRQYAGWLVFDNKLSEAGDTLLKAQHLFKATADTLTSDYSTLLTDIGNIALAREEYDEAEEYMLQSLALAEKVDGRGFVQYAMRQYALAQLYYTQQRYSEAAPLIEESYATVKKNVPSLARTMYDFDQYLALIYWANDSFKKSNPYFLKANNMVLDVIKNNFPAMSEKEKGQFWAKIYGWFEKYKHIAIEESSVRAENLADVFNIQLSTKAILLNSTKKVRQRIMQSGDEKLISLYNQWMADKEELAKMYALPKEGMEKTIEQQEEKLNSVEKMLSERSEVFARAGEKKNPTWEDIRGALKSGEAAVEIIRVNGYSKELEYTDAIYYAALIVTPEMKKNPQLVLLKNGAEMESDFLKNYQQRIRQKMADGNSYSAYWEKIDSVLKPFKTIYISADGVYNQINLNTLLKPNGKYLAEEKDIRLVTNTKDILLKEKTTLLKKQKAELFGFPKYNLNKEDHAEAVLAYAERDRSRDVEFDDFDELSRAGITELPGTKTEIENVSAIIAGKQTPAQKFLGAESLEEAVKSVESPYILHIATHGFFLSDPDKMKGKKIFGMERSRALENPLLRSGLLFAGATNTITGKQTNTMLDDGILTAYEAMNLNLDNTELVVLSACETGLGEVKNGEGVYGLQRAFQVAGAKTLIMSLWKVNDDATQELMTTFYKNWLGGMDKHAAFKSAQFSLKEKYKHPYFWGAFVMVGN